MTLNSVALCVCWDGKTSSESATREEDAKATYAEDNHKPRRRVVMEIANQKRTYQRRRHTPMRNGRNNCTVQVKKSKMQRR